MRTAHFLTLATVMSALLAGCGGPRSISRGTPEATAKAFVEAMKAGDYDMVARGFDYETYARHENPDWDTFGESQRRLIVGKLQESKAAELQALSGMFTGEAAAGEASERDGRAQVSITAGANTLILHMAQIGQDWHLRRIEESTDR